MAGEWIKMRTNLWDDPRVSQLCDLANMREAQVIGGLYWLWSAADEHTENGYMPGLSLAAIDRKTGLKGFASALIHVGWLADTDGGVTLNRFDEHNGSSAKRRGADAQRKASVRKVSAPEADNERNSGGQPRTSCGAREEKRREETKKTGESTRVARTTPIDRPVDVTEKTWADFQQLRKSKRAPVTDTVVAEARLECEKAGVTLERFLTIWCMRGSQGLQAEWLRADERRPATGETPYQKSQRDRVAEFAPGVVKRPDAIDVEATNVTLIAGR